MNSVSHSRPPARVTPPIWAICCGTFILCAFLAGVIGGLNTESPTKALQMASAYNNAGDYGRAETLLKRTWRQNAGNAYVSNELAWTLYLERKYAEAEPYAVSSVARRRRAFNLDTLEHIELSLGKVDTAEIGFKEVLAQNPKYADSLDGLGQVCERRGRLADALSYYLRAKGYKPTIKGIDDRIAHVRQLLGQKPAHGTP